MKNFTKVKASLVKQFSLIIILAVITALVAVSCVPPEVEETAYDWSSANERNDPSKSSAAGQLSFDLIGPREAAAKNPEITIEFPPESDFLRAGNIGTALKEFLTVNNFAKPETDPNGNDGKSDTLTSVDYTFVNRADRSVTIKVDKDYTGTGAYSDLIVKIDSTKYKHSNGLLMDTDSNGKPGEAGYDDYYLRQGVTGSAALLKKDNFTEPGNMDWYVNISINTGGGPLPFEDADATTFTAPAAPVATINADGVSTSSTNGKAIFKDIADLVVGGIKIEKLGANGVWTAESATAVYDADYTPDGVSIILFKDLTLTHNNVYRVTWKGNGNLQTTGTYFGVRQRIFVTPDVDFDTYEVYGTPDVSGYTRKAIYGLTQVSSRAIAVNNSGIKTYFNPNTSWSRYNYDLDGKKNVINFRLTTFPGSNTEADPYIGLDGTVIDNLAAFKKSFRIFYNSSNLNDVGAIFTNANVIELDIKDVKGITNPIGVDTNGIDTLRITIDPDFIWRTGYYFILINDGIGFTGGKYVFGNPNNYEYGNFTSYRITQN